MNALLRKEFRESVRWLPLGWLLMGGLLWTALPSLGQLERATQPTGTITPVCLICSSFIALGLSIAQFAPDQRSAARAFLLHRGLTPVQVFRGKLIIGVAIYSMAVGIPLLLSTMYLEWIGPLRLPTSARQTIPAWLVSIYCFSFYFGGCMVVCGNARWIGTRVLPLAISCLVTTSPGALNVPVPLGTDILIPVLGAIGLVVLFLASQDTFKNGVLRVTPSKGLRSYWPRDVVLTIAAIAATMAALIVPINFTESNDLYQGVSTDVDASGDLWFVLEERGFPIERARINADAESMVIEKVTRDSQERQRELNYIYALPTANKLRFSAETLVGQQFEQRSQLVFDPSGFILAYNTTSIRSDRPSWMLSYVIGQDRITRPLEPRGKPFTTTPVLVQKNWLILKDGIYRLDQELGSVRRVVSMQVDGYAEFSRTKEKQDYNKLFLYDKSSLVEYELPKSFGPSDSLEPIATIDVGPDLRCQICRFAYASQDDFSLVEQKTEWGFQIIQKRPGKELERFTCSAPVGMRPPNAGQSDFVNGFLFMAVPVGSFFIAGICVMIAVYGFGVSLTEVVGDGPPPEWMVAGVILFVVQALLSCLLAYFATRHRGLSKSARIGWSIGGALGGFGVALAVIAIYPRCIREACSHCKKLRRVELMECEHCGFEWVLPACDGIEVLQEVPVPMCIP